MGVALIGTVESSYRVLRTLIEAKAPLDAVLSLAPADAVGVSDYADLRGLAETHGIPHRYIKNVNAPSVVSFLSDLKPDVLFVIGWSQLVRKVIIDIPRYGCIGAHPALLPRNRGRAVIPWVLIQDEPETGMTLFYINEGTDSGDIIAQTRLPICEVDTAQSLYERAVQALCQMLRTHLPTILDGTAPRMKQDESRASYCAKRGPEDGLINWGDSTRSIFNLVRAVTRPYPGAFTYYGTQRLMVWAAQPGTEAWTGIPGQILRLDPERGALVKTGDGTLWITELEPEGFSGPPVKPLGRVGDRLTSPESIMLLQRVRELEERLTRLEGNMPK